MPSTPNLKHFLGRVFLAIKFHPRTGQILLCDFSEGFLEPEMTKSGRPVVVLSTDMKGRNGLVTVAALSTTEPKPCMSYHYKIPLSSMPQLGRFQQSDSWLKVDMIYTVGFHRLDLIRLGKKNPQTGKREYFNKRLRRDQMNEIYRCILNGMNLGNLGNYL